MLKQRILTAVIIAPLILAALFLLPPKWFALVIGLIMVIGATEWAPLMGWKSVAGKAVYAVLVGIAMMASAFSIFSPDMTDLVNVGLAKALLFSAALWWVIAIGLVLTFPKSKHIWNQSYVIRGGFGLLAIVPTWVAFVLLRSINIDQQFYFGALVVCFVFGIVWSADIGAYFFGKRFGSRKLMPYVSPGKTLEGLTGGLLCAGLFAVVVANGMEYDSMHTLQLLFVSVVIALISAFGDLTESMLKREAGVKDSGSILPGHGGILDRIDSLLAALPIFALAYLEWLR